MNNPNIINDGISTRFGAINGPDPKGTPFRAPPWSIKNRLRRLMAFPLDGSKKPTTKNLLKWLAGPNSKADLSMLVAIKVFEEAMKDGNSMIKLINMIDGKK